jgi:hypothetical protein
MPFHRVFFILISAIASFFLVDSMGYEAVYILNISFIINLIIEVYILSKNSKGLIFLKTPLLFNYFVFFSHLGAYYTMFLVVDKETILAGEFDILSEMTPKMYLKGLFLINLACTFSWQGYYSSIGKHLYLRYTKLPFYERLFSSEYSWSKLMILNFSAYAIKFYLFSIGLYGRLVNEQYFEVGKGYKAGSELRIFGNLSYITLFLIAYLFLSKIKTGPVIRIVLIVSFVLEVFFGSVYGARSTFIYPFLIMFIAHSLSTNKLQKVYLVILPLVLSIAFTFILDFKNYSLSDDFGKKSNPIEQFKSFLSSGYSSSDVSNETAIAGFQEYFASSGHSSTVAIAVDYADHDFYQQKDVPNFKLSFLRIPFDALIPKFIQGKQEFTWGLWFKDNVVKHATDLVYSLAITPVGFLYLTGGMMMVIIGFYFQGIILNFTECFLTNRQSIFSLISFMLLTAEATGFDSITSNYLTNIIRMVFIFPVFYWLMLSKASKI